MMASRPAFYPDSHAQALERVMRVIDLIAARPDITDEEAVAALMREGVGEVSLLKRTGVGKFSSTRSGPAGQWVELPLANEHYFSATLGSGTT